MKIELKSVKLFEELSEETEAFTATLFVDGVRLADVSNRGSGGPHDLTPVEGKTYGDIKFLDEWCKSHLPKWGADFGDGDVYDTDLELQISHLVEAERKIQKIKKLLRGKLVLVDDDCDPKKGEHYKTPKKNLDKVSQANFLSHHKNPIALNDLHPLEAQRLLHHGKLKFSIGGESDQTVYEGVNYGFCGGMERWNGWLVPAVTKNVFDRLVKDQEAFIKRFTEDGEVTVIEDDEDVIENFEALKNTKPTENGLYILNHGWIWDEV